MNKTHSKQTYMTNFNIITTSHPYPQYLYHVICVKVKKNNKLSQLYPIIKSVHIWRGENSNAVCCNNIWTWPWTPCDVTKPSCCSISHAAHGYACLLPGRYLVFQFINTYPPAMVHVFRQLSTHSCLFRMLMLKRYCVIKQSRYFKINCSALTRGIQGRYDLASQLVVSAI